LFHFLCCLLLKTLPPCTLAFFSKITIICRCVRFFYIVYIGMVIRNLRQKKILNGKMLFRILLAIIGIYLASRILTSISERYNQNSTSSDMYTLWASLTFEGKVIVDNDFPNYTHSLLTNKGKKIGLKSSTINLNSYTDKKIEIVGTLKKYLKLTPILDINSIKIPDQWLVITANRYFFVKDLMYLDFTSQPQLSASRSWNNIQVMFNGAPVVTIERFVCSKILKSRDCTSLVSDYIQNDKDTFESYRSYTFYKHGTWFWTTFDDNQYGFMFKDVSDDMILDISNMFKIVNKDFVVQNKLNLIKSDCQNDFSQLASIDSQGTMTYHDPYTVTLALQWRDKKNDPATCRITFDIWNGWNVSDVQFN